jgi:phage terminase large subunit GpA-like protein
MSLHCCYRIVVEGDSTVGKSKITVCVHIYSIETQTQHSINTHQRIDSFMEIILRYIHFNVSHN